MFSLGYIVEYLLIILVCQGFYIYCCYILLDHFLHLQFGSINLWTLFEVSRKPWQTSCILKMSKNYTKPPSMCEPYSNWKLLIDLWSESTDYSAAQQGPILVLNLTGDARDAALSIPKEKLKSADGVKLIMQKLDTLYEKDATQLAFLAFDKFVKYRRPEDMDVNEFLRKFELMKNKCETYKFVIPENILAYFMLSCANLPKDKEDIIRATILELKTSDMRSQILKVYTELSTAQSSSSESRTPAVKVEPLESSALPVMYTSLCEHEYNTPNHVYYGNNFYRGNRGRGRGRARFHKSSSSQQSYNVKKIQCSF